jgi:hypothetical protein
MQAASFNLQLSNPDNLPQNTAIATKTGALPAKRQVAGLIRKTSAPRFAAAASLTRI